MCSDDEGDGKGRLGGGQFMRQRQSMENKQLEQFHGKQEVKGHCTVVQAKGRNGRLQRRGARYAGVRCSAAESAGEVHKAAMAGRQRPRSERACRALSCECSQALLGGSRRYCSSRCLGGGPLQGVGKRWHTSLSTGRVMKEMMSAGGRRVQAGQPRVRRSRAGQAAAAAGRGLVGPAAAPLPPGPARLPTRVAVHQSHPLLRVDHPVPGEVHLAEGLRQGRGVRSAESRQQQAGRPCLLAPLDAVLPRPPAPPQAGSHMPAQHEAMPRLATGKCPISRGPRTRLPAPPSCPPPNPPGPQWCPGPPHPGPRRGCRP
jgi:hypothetical protein